MQGTIRIVYLMPKLKDIDDDSLTLWVKDPMCATYAIVSFNCKADITLQQAINALRMDLHV